MTCDDQHNAADTLAFNLAKVRHGDYAHVRAAYSDHFNMKKEDWDEDWGYNTGLPERAFAKMIASGFVLERGVAAYPETTTTVWERIALTAGLTVPIRNPLSSMLVVQAIPGLEAEPAKFLSSHVFFTDTAGTLHHAWEEFVGDPGPPEFQYESVSAGVTTSGETRVGSIVATIDPPLEAAPEAASCLAGRSSLVTATVDPNAILSVVGRDPQGEVVIFYRRLHQSAEAWRVVTLASVFSVAAEAGGALDGVTDVPLVFKRGSSENHRIDVFIRAGLKLVHYSRAGSNASFEAGWSGEVVTSFSDAAQSSQAVTAAEFRTGPTGLTGDAGELHLFARNQNGALMHYTHFPEQLLEVSCPFPTAGKARAPSLFGGVLPCTLPVAARWQARNVDNELDGVDVNAVVAHNDVAGDLAVTRSLDGIMHVCQRRTGAPNGLAHYALEQNVWKRQLLSTAGSTVLGGHPTVVAIDEPELRPEDFPFDVAAVDLVGDLQVWTAGSSIDDGSWFRDNVTAQAVQMSNPEVLAGFKVRDQVAMSIRPFEDWVMKNVVARHSASSEGLVRSQWVNRAGWASDALAGTGWTSEVIPDSAGMTGKPAINDRLFTMDVFAFQNGSTPAGTFAALMCFRLLRDRPWHSRRDYFFWASGARHGFEYVPEEANETDADALAEASGYPYWNVNMQCPCFADWTDENGDPRPIIRTAQRATVMLHEATHVNEDLRGSVRPLGHEEVDGVEMDEWLSHGLLAMEPGDLEPSSHPHNPYQIEIEFLADLGQFPARELPRILWESATVDATNRMNQKIIDIPPWTPGEPRPF